MIDYETLIKMAYADRDYPAITRYKDELKKIGFFDEKIERMLLHAYESVSKETEGCSVDFSE